MTKVREKSIAFAKKTEFLKKKTKDRVLNVSLSNTR